MRRHIACPIALHPDGAPLRVPLFQTPQAGLQIVCGSLGKAERPEAAAARHLFEQSGLETRSALYLGTSDGIVDGEDWHFALCRLVPPVRDAWRHMRAEDSGPVLEFGWHALETSQPDCGPVSARALDYMRAAL